MLHCEAIPKNPRRARGFFGAAASPRYEATVHLSRFVCDEVVKAKKNA
jgi:hypothetical protein